MYIGLTQQGDVTDESFGYLTYRGVELRSRQLANGARERTFRKNVPVLLLRDAAKDAWRVITKDECLYEVGCTVESLYMTSLYWNAKQFEEILQVRINYRPVTCFCLPGE